MRSLFLILLTVFCLGIAVAQDADKKDEEKKPEPAKVRVEYFPADIDDALDINHPGLQDQMIDFGLSAPAPGGKFLEQVLKPASLREVPLTQAHASKIHGWRAFFLQRNDSLN